MSGEDGVGVGVGVEGWKRSDNELTPYKAITYEDNMTDKTP